MKRLKLARILGVFILFVTLLSGYQAIASDIPITVTIRGLEPGDKATLSLTSMAPNADAIFEQTLVGEEKGEVTITVAQDLKDDNFQLMLDAPEKYFRDPKGYFFKVYQSKIVNPANRSIVFDLIPPSAQKFIPYRGSNNVSIETSASLLPPTPSSTWGRIPDMLERIISLSGPVKQHQSPDTILSTGYHYFGTNTTTSNNGLWGRFAVVDPGVQHDIDPYWEFVDDHVYVCNGDYTKWIEAGWAECSWLPDTRYMFSMDGVDQTWNTWSLPTGTTLEVAVLQSSGTTWEAQYYASGSWHVLESKDIGFSTPSHTYNAGEVYTDMGTHPSLPSATTDVSKLYISGSWNSWTSAYTTTIDSASPYDAHVTTQYYNFYIHKH